MHKCNFFSNFICPNLSGFQLVEFNALSKSKYFIRLYMTKNIDYWLFCPSLIRAPIPKTISSFVWRTAEMILNILSF